MESIITDIVKIIKSENNVLAREKALMCYFFDLIGELMKLALEEVDVGLVDETKKQGYLGVYKMENLVTEFAHTQDIADNKLVSYTLYKSHRIYIKQVYWSETMNWLVGYAEIQKENPIYSKLTNSQDLYMLPLEK